MVNQSAADHITEWGFAKKKKEKEKKQMWESDACKTGKGLL